MTDIFIPVSHAQYVYTFYTTFVFKLERQILTWAVSRPSTDIQAKQLSEGLVDTFAAWRVEARTGDQLLLSDYLNRTKSWLMVVPLEAGGGTHLYFGSAVVPGEGKLTLGPAFRALLGFHKLYSMALLYAARSRLEKLHG